MKKNTVTDATPEIASFTMLVINDGNHDTARALQTLTTSTSKKPIFQTLWTLTTSKTMPTRITMTTSATTTTPTTAAAGGNTKSSYDAKC